ncbi:predicted protein [Lichtheimia corymbifera JMRC:FSU:9682]|uniref:Uncharacterized protein n=1 Tax=Lichtheimia corymbifera JMRC:FSU:9682 TaxID=1263082 RepID=A0A068SH44_9FUNG|nr:predicted protein [Lichtheimia corymbifera JMRC:FSU:9682]
MKSDHDIDLNELVNQLSSQVHGCLERILIEPQQPKQDEGSKSLETYTDDLKATAMALERQLKDVRLRSLGDRKLAVNESISLLKRDIELKQNAIDKYASKLDQWSNDLPVLVAKSKQVVLHRTDGKDIDHKNVQQQPKKDEKDEEMVEEL